MSELETPVLREGTPDDLAQIAPLFIRSLDTSIPGVTWSDSPANAPAAVAEKLRARLFPPQTLRLYVLERPSTREIVAFGNVKPAPGGRAKEPEGNGESEGEGKGEGGGPTVGGDQDELDLFFVKRELGGRGYGALLLEAFQREWAGRGGLQLHAFEKNLHAIRFYEKRGFWIVEGGEEQWQLDSLKEPRVETAVLMSWRPSV